ncbi:MAG: RNA-directed DNA polymerase [Archangium sp.]
MSVTRLELLAAYRRCKADMHEQRGLPTALQFATFEENLRENLDSVLASINNPESSIGAGGTVFLLPRQSDEEEIDLDPSSSAAAEKALSPNYRRLFMPNLPLLLLSSLWMDRVGSILERQQSRFSYGNRLRLDRKGRLFSQGPSFKPYIGSYTRWRDRALGAARQMASRGQSAEILAFDIQSFYGSVDARFLLDQEILNLDVDKLRLTERLVEAVVATNGSGSGLGLPIGLPASAVIANAALAKVDAKISSIHGTIYYGRYVDDFLLVRGVGAGDKPEDILKKALVDSPHQGTIQASSTKTKSLIVGAEHAKVLLRELHASFSRLSSEWRSLPSRESLGRLTDLAIETRSGRTLGRNIRDSETLAVKRWTFSALLSRFSRYTANLSPHDWAPEWKKIYDRLAPIATAAANLPSTTKHLREFIALTILSANDELAADLGRRLRVACDVIAEVRKNIGAEFRNYIKSTIEDSMVVSVGSVPPSGTSSARLQSTFSELYGAFLNVPVGFDAVKFHKFSSSAFVGDFGLRPVWENVLGAVLIATASPPDWINQLPRLRPLTRTAKRLSSLLSRAMAPSNSASFTNLANWLTLAARPPSASALTLLAGDGSNDWRRVVIKLTGKRPPKPPQIENGVLSSPFPDWSKERLRALVIATGNIETADDWFVRAAQGSPVESEARSNRLNAAFDRMNFHDTVDICVTPELSIPRRFALDLARSAASRGTTSVLGLEYQLVGESAVLNEVLLCFAGPSGQYWLLRQPKLSPAHVERVELWRISNRTLTEYEPNRPKPIYRHRGLFFGVLICSELLNATHRQNFRGKIDLLCVPEWNRDTSFFDELTSAASMDVHCFVAQSNNRRYGDSLVRGPARNEWERMIVRIRGGLGDEFVGGRINVESLRQFQSHAVSPDSPFKPIPDGYELARVRRRTGSPK